MKTLENLSRIYINKCQQCIKYRMLADLCKTQEMGVIAKYFKNLSAQEFTHAKIINSLIRELREDDRIVKVDVSLKELKSKDVQLAINEELAQEKGNGVNRYKTYARIARDEGYKDISNILILLSEAENNHSTMLEAVKMKIAVGTELFECEGCGLKLNSKIKECPLCSEKKL